MPMLHEVLAVEQSKKTAAGKILDEAVSQFKSHKDRYEGMIRTYTPKAEDGDMLPPEEKQLGDRVHSKLEYMFGIFGQYVDVALTKDATNCTAKSDVIVGGKVLLADVPATGLLFLERELKRVRSVFDNLPTLDPAAKWSWTEEQNCYVADELEQTRTKKTPFAFERAPATQQHPAQVDILYEDAIVGTFQKKRYSGAIGVREKAEAMQRIDALINGVVEARMRANQEPAKLMNAAKVLEEYLLLPLKR